MKVRCSPIVWNHPSSASVLLCLHGAKYFKQHLAIPIFKYAENMFIYTNMFFYVSKFWSG